jgi:diaminopimelate epimerase
LKLKFTKMHGAGNDFVMLDATREPLALSPGQIRALADRHFGVGADQVLVVETPSAGKPGTASERADFRYRIFNADGGEVEHCGNGARCFVKFVRDRGLTDKTTIRVEVQRGLITLSMKPDGSVEVEMGVPDCTPAQVPFEAAGLTSRREGEDDLWPLEIDGKTAWLSVVTMGNPHAVQVVADTEAWPVAVDGPLLERHLRFPRRVNAGFMQVLDRHSVKLRVYERGAGETLACGTGACAAVVAGIRRGLLDSPVTVHTHGGDLSIAWSGAQVRMSGPAITVFEGEIELAEV